MDKAGVQNVHRAHLLHNNVSLFLILLYNLWQSTQNPPRYKDSQHIFYNYSRHPLEKILSAPSLSQDYANDLSLIHESYNCTQLYHERLQVDHTSSNPFPNKLMPMSLDARDPILYNEMPTYLPWSRLQFYLVLSLHSQYSSKTQKDDCGL